MILQDGMPALREKREGYGESAKANSHFADLEAEMKGKYQDEMLSEMSTGSWQWLVHMASQGPVVYFCESGRGPYERGIAP